MSFELKILYCTLHAPMGVASEDASIDCSSLGSLGAGSAYIHNWFEGIDIGF